MKSDNDVQLSIRVRSLIYGLGHHFTVNPSHVSFIIDKTMLFAMDKHYNKRGFIINKFVLFNWSVAGSCVYLFYHFLKIRIVNIKCVI